MATCGVAGRDPAPELRGSAPAGEDISVSIGGVAIELRGLAASLAEAAQERYREFLPEFHGGKFVGPARARLWVDCAQAEPMAGVEFHYRLNSCVLEMQGTQARFSGMQNVYELDSLLRILLSQVLVEQSGFLSHAATVEHDGRAYIFMGRSGAGKSTVASLSPAQNVFTDEISLVRCRGEEWRAHGTPFWGEFRADGKNRSAPLAGIYALVQAKQNRAETLTRKRAIAELLGNAVFFSQERAQREMLLETFSRLAAEVPVARLEFRKDATFWDLVTR